MPVIRTDFSDQATWEAVRAAIVAPSADGFVASVDVIDDPDFTDATTEQLLDLATEDVVGHQHCLLVVDRITTASTEWPVLVIDLQTDRGRRFRCAASQLHGVENNLSISNMDFFEFADHVEADGVFRGF